MLGREEQILIYFIFPVVSTWFVIVSGYLIVVNVLLDTDFKNIKVIINNN